MSIDKTDLSKVMNNETHVRTLGRRHVRIIL